MLQLTREQVVMWTGARLIREGTGPAAEPIPGVSSDSRSLKAGELFIALHGDRFDGHAFLRQAAERGAGALLIDDPQSLADCPDLALPVLQVPDTLKALQDLAAGYRQTLPGQVVAITGSVGKTSTRQMVAACLKPALRVHQTAANRNNEIGLPETMLDADRQDQAIVVELGMRGPGEISLLSRIARPDIALITCIGWSHIGRLGSREAILAAKWEIVEGLGPGGLLILNADDPLLLQAADQLSGDIRLALVTSTPKGRQAAHALNRPLAFLLSAGPADASAEQTRFTACCSVSGQADETVAVMLPFPGQHHVRNALFGLAAARALHVSLAAAAAGAAGCPADGNRQKLVRTHDITIMDDAYNAAPESMEAALEALAVLAGHGGRKVAALGCMLELGPFAPEAHRQVGERVAELGFGLLLAYGPEADDLLIGARTVNPEIPSCSCQDHEEMAGRLSASLQPGDFLLIKGSRGYAMEKVTALLLEQLGSGRKEEQR
ncbi:MAG: UDP-N-acetylmuramoyl-tripeptide--D-alanyl-D-alanine ligase [Clostridiaceae bacterium]|jgi:UDP-N-acetylmuramoyl-tripeptide--D-alanyl-D-alanine ligase|nr:UDP-N-acetylmuramoyl-tripeptide--D-alanyl-D-alanine ligase [Clostridiaceae bacterium]